MCGIAGIVNHPDATVEDVQAMVSTVRHRGPDDEGVHRIGRCIIGHTRLAVVDPEHGGQPMSNTDNTVWVTFNGEIYNFVELREELKAKGYIFKSRCDTEVLVHLWRAEGEAMIDRLIGMFAFFLWDVTADCGVLVRDHSGIKPCYVMRYGRGFAFCSEIKGLLRLPGVTPRINPNALVQTLAFNYCPTAATCFDGIRQLEPGTWLHFSGDAAPRTRRYWQWPLLEERRRPDSDEFMALVDDAVRLQMRFDVGGGLLLSGGVDSTLVASRLGPQWPHDRLDAIGLEMSVPEYSEYPFSQEVAHSLDIDLVPLRITPEQIPEIAEEVAGALLSSRTVTSPSFSSSFLRAAHQQGKIVMFSGDGPDEALLGFNHNMSFFAEHDGSSLDDEAYFRLITYTTPEELGRIVNADILAAADNPLETFRNRLAPWRELPAHEQVIAYECTTLMPANNLAKSDRMAAPWAIEGRSPFLDHRVLEMLTRLPPSDKFEPLIGKAYLKRQAQRHLPGIDFFRRKRMPTTPIGVWLQGPLYEWARETLASIDDGILLRGPLLEMLEAHRAGAHNHTRPLRVALMTALWLRAYGAT